MKFNMDLFKSRKKFFLVGIGLDVLIFSIPAIFLVCLTGLPVWLGLLLVVGGTAIDLVAFSALFKTPSRLV